MAKEPSAFGGPISRESLSQRAYVAIRESLMRSRLRPGQKLVARQVADELNISVTPVRESLLRLVSEHALILDDRGTVVVPRMSLDRCIEIRDIRILNEGEGAARAAVLASDEDITRLEQIHERYKSIELQADYEAALTENENFHFMLCRLSGSKALFGIVENLWIQFGPILAYLYDDGKRPFYGETHAHTDVIKALRNRDPDMARKAIAHDIIRGGQVIIDRLSAAEKTEVG